MPLLDPAMCTVLLLNPDLAPLATAAKPRGDVSKRQALIRSAAATAAIPVYLLSRTCAGENDDHAMVEQQLHRTCRYSPASLRKLWTEGGFSQTISQQSRPSLVVAGTWLETDVTFLALSALVDGFDVYIALDASSSQFRGSRRAAVHRLIQAGAIPLSTPQMVAEWAERAKHDPMQGALLELLASR